MYVARVPNRGSPPAILLRESYREGGKVKNPHPGQPVALARAQGRRAGPRAQGPAAGGGICPRRLRSPAACRTGMSPRCWAPREQLGMAELIDPAPVAQPGSGVRDAGRDGDRAGLQAGDRARAAHRDRHQLPGAGAGRGAAVMRTTCMRRWTGCWPAKTPSKTPWPPGIWPTARWCSMTCPRRRSRAAPARWGRSGTPATGSKAGCRSSTGCCAHRRGADRHRGVRGQHRRPQHPGRPDRQAQDPVRADPGVPGRGSGHAHQRAHPRRAAPGAAGLDQRAARPADQGPRRGRGAAAVAVR